MVKCFIKAKCHITITCFSVNVLFYSLLKAEQVCAWYMVFVCFNSIWHKTAIYGSRSFLLLCVINHPQSRVRYTYRGINAILLLFFTKKVLTATFGTRPIVKRCVNRKGPQTPQPFPKTSHPANLILSCNSQVRKPISRLTAAWPFSLVDSEQLIIYPLFALPFRCFNSIARTFLGHLSNTIWM